MNIEGIGDEVSNEFGENMDILERAADDEVISPEEQPEVLKAIKHLTLLRGGIEESAVTLRAVGQIARIGVSRFPNPHMRREIVELAAYRRGFAATANVVPFKRRAAKSRTANASGDAA